jgi:hypothetical protein
MDGRTYIEEIKSRIHRYAVAENLNDLEIMTYVNIVRKTIQRYVMKAMPERFGRIYKTQITSTPIDYLSVNYKNIFMYPALLPDNFIEELVVKVNWTEIINTETVPFSRQARKAEHTEIHKISMNSFTTPFILQPIYNMGQENGNPNPLAKTIMIGGLDGASNTLFELSDSDPEVEIWYLAMLDDLEFADRETVYVGDLQELVILQSIMMCLQRSSPDAVYPILKSEIDQLTQIIQGNYDAIIAERELNIESKQS